MPESLEHMSYVRNIVDYVTSMLSGSSYLIEADLPEYSGRTTQALGKFYPDVFYRDDRMIVIGEAKTDYDIVNAHTGTLIDAYIRHAKLYDLEKHIVLSGSMYSFAELTNMAIRKKRQADASDIHFHIIAPHVKPYIT